MPQWHARYFSWKHMASTKHLNLIRFKAVDFASCHVRLFSVLVRLQVIFRRPRFLKPWEFHSSDILVILSGFFRMVWPIQLHFIFLICFSMGFSTVIIHSSKFTYDVRPEYNNNMWCISLHTKSKQIFLSRQLMTRILLIYYFRHLSYNYNNKPLIPFFTK